MALPLPNDIAAVIDAAGKENSFRKDLQRAKDDMWIDLPKNSVDVLERILKTGESGLEFDHDAFQEWRERLELPPTKNQIVIESTPSGKNSFYDIWLDRIETSSEIFIAPRKEEPKKTPLIKIAQKPKEKVRAIDL